MMVTYIAPNGDAETVEMGGFRFRDGVSVEVPAGAKIAPKLATNQHFIVDEDGEAGDDSDDAPKRRGRPRKASE